MTPFDPRMLEGRVVDVFTTPPPPPSLRNLREGLERSETRNHSCVPLRLRRVSSRMSPRCHRLPDIYPEVLGVPSRGGDPSGGERPGPRPPPTFIHTDKGSPVIQVIVFREPPDIPSHILKYELPSHYPWCSYDPDPPISNGSRHLSLRSSGLPGTYHLFRNLPPPNSRVPDLYSGRMPSS